MIHAYLMQTNEEDDDGYGYLDENNREIDAYNHGPNFQAQMNVINEMAKLNVKVTHDYLARRVGNVSPAPNLLHTICYTCHFVIQNRYFFPSPSDK